MTARIPANRLAFSRSPSNSATPTRAKLTNVPKSLRIPRTMLDALLTDARTHAPNESCGLLAGRNSTITNFYPAENVSASPTTTYEIAPRALFQLFREMRAKNLDLLAIYHSHPATENAPSPTDIAQAYYPETPYIIVDPRPNATNPIRAFQIREGQVIEIAVESNSGDQ